jgi:pimeloyl-ACP methyl ester carboxylesterase
MRRLYVDGQWGQIHVRVAGAGQMRPPLLMLHQTPKSGWIWQPLFAQLGTVRTLIAPDTPGYGASDPPGSQASIEGFAGEMLTLMNQLERDDVIAPGPIDLIGYHTGSVTAVAMATIAPERVRRIALVSLAAYSPEVRAAKLAALPAEVALDEDGAHLTRMWQSIDAFTDRRASLAWKQASLTENLRAGARMYDGYRAVYRYDLEAALRVLPHETLILNPGDDLFEPTRAAARRVPHARYIELAGVGHGLFEFETRRICDILADFLDT